MRAAKLVLLATLLFAGRAFGQVEEKEPTAILEIGGAGEWAHTIKGGKSENSIGGEAALDFMFWPWPKRRVGWYAEPSYGYSFASGHEQSMSMTVGLLIAIR